MKLDTFTSELKFLYFCEAKLILAIPLPNFKPREYFLLKSNVLIHRLIFSSSHTLQFNKHAH